MYEEIKPMGPKVGVVLDIDGRRLMYRRRMPSGMVGNWQAYPGMPVFLNDHLESDSTTTAALEFTIGGRAVISRSTEIVVVGQREIRVVGNQFLITSKKMWSKVGKNDGKGFQPQVDWHTGKSLEG